MGSSPLTEAELQELVSKAQDGDTASFERLYDHFFASVYRYTAFRLPAEVAEDVVADVFVKVWEKLHTYKPHSNVPFGAWLFRIARHSVIDSYRTHRGFEEMTENFVDPDDLNRADTKTRRGDTLRVVRNALAQLPKRYREILLLSFMAELPHGEIARVLRMTEGGVRILKLRALRKLEGLLPPEAGEGP